MTTIFEAKYHRNGGGGVGAFLVKFYDDEQKEMLYAVFFPDEDDKHYTQVFNPVDIRQCYRSADCFWQLLKDAQDEIETKAFGVIADMIEEEWT